MTKYTVALSFSGEDRALAEDVATGLKESGVTVFYDKFEEHSLWGENLHEKLQSIYTEECRFCVMLVSESYLDRMWTVFERQQIVDRLAKEHGKGSVLPVRLCGFTGKIPGLSNGIGYLTAETHEASKIVGLLLKKINEKPSDNKTKQKGTKTQQNFELRMAKPDPIRNMEQVNGFLKKYHSGQIPPPKRPALVSSPINKALALISAADQGNISRERLIAEHGEPSFYALRSFGLIKTDGRVNIPGRRKDKSLDDSVRPVIAESPTITCIAGFLEVLPNAVAEDVGDLLSSWLGKKWTSTTKASYGSSMRQWTLWARPDIYVLVSNSVKDQSGNYSRLLGRTKQRPPVITKAQWYEAKRLFLKGLSCYSVSKEIGVVRTTLYNYQEMILRGDEYPFNKTSASRIYADSVPKVISEEKWVAAHAMLKYGFSATRVAETLNITKKTFSKYKHRMLAGESYPGAKSKDNLK